MRSKRLLYRIEAGYGPRGHHVHRHRAEGRAYSYTDPRAAEAEAAALTALDLGRSADRAGLAGIAR